MTPQIPFRRRLLTVGGFILVTFLVGSLIFHSFAEGHIAQYYWAAVALFPAGFVFLGLGKASVPAGWSVYALCLSAMLSFGRKKPFLIACAILVMLIVMNLFGCAALLGE